MLQGWSQSVDCRCHGNSQNMMEKSSCRQAAAKKLHAVTACSIFQRSMDGSAICGCPHLFVRATAIASEIRLNLGCDVKLCRSPQSLNQCGTSQSNNARATLRPEMPISRLSTSNNLDCMVNRMGCSRLRADSHGHGSFATDERKMVYRSGYAANKRGI